MTTRNYTLTTVSVNNNSIRGVSFRDSNGIFLFLSDVAKAFGSSFLKHLPTRAEHIERIVDENNNSQSRKISAKEEVFSALRKAGKLRPECEPYPAKAAMDCSVEPKETRCTKASVSSCSSTKPTLSSVQLKTESVRKFKDIVSSVSKKQQQIEAKVNKVAAVQASLREVDLQEAVIESYSQLFAEFERLLMEELNPSSLESYGIGESFRDEEEPLTYLDLLKSKNLLPQLLLVADAFFPDYTSQRYTVTIR